MTRCLVAMFALFSLAAPAFADVCAAATEVATRTALDSAAAAGRRTSTVRVSCGGETQTLVLHRVDGASGGSVIVREVKKRKGGKALAAGSKTDFDASSSARVIRVGE